MTPSRDDPLNEILLPAYDFATRIKNDERASRPGEKLLAGALLVLIAERDVTRWLYRVEREQSEREREYSRVLEEEADAAAVDRAKSYLRLRNRTGVVA